MNTREDLLEESGQWDSPTGHYDPLSYTRRSAMSNFFAVSLPMLNSIHNPANRMRASKDLGYHLKNGLAQLKRALRIGK
jgi:hypothetical protein